MHCACTRTTVSHLRGLFSTLFNHTSYVKYSTELQLLTELQCHRMAKWQDSSAGKLQWDGVSWSTQNSLQWKPPNNVFHSSTWVSHQIDNCYVYFAPIFHKDPPPQVGAVGARLAPHCSYPHGRCALYDGWVVMWDPQQIHSNCLYPLQPGSIDGFEMFFSQKGLKHYLWVAQDGSRVTFTDETEEIYDQLDCSVQPSKVIPHPYWDRIDDQIFSLASTTAPCSNGSINLAQSLFLSSCSRLQLQVKQIQLLLRTNPTTLL